MREKPSTFLASRREALNSKLPDAHARYTQGLATLQRLASELDVSEPMLKRALRQSYGANVIRRRSGCNPEEQAHAA